ncbi:protein Atg16l2 isoform X2 [Lissotriton helveticus]
MAAHDWTPDRRLTGQRSLPCWKEHISMELRQRDRAQKARYEQMFQSYNMLLEKTCLLRHITESLQIEPSETRPPEASEKTKFLECCVGIHNMEVAHREKMENVQMCCGELSIEIIEKEKILNEKCKIVDEQKSRMLEEQKNDEEWKNEALECREEVRTLENENQEWKRNYDDLLKKRERTQEEFRRAEDEMECIVADIKAYNNDKAEKQNAINDRIKQENKERELKRIAREVARIGKTPPDVKEKCTNDCSGKPDDQRLLQRPKRSASSVEPRASSFHGFIKTITRKPRSNSMCSYSEERYQPLPICVLSRVPSRALCVLDTFDSEVNAVKFSPNSKLLATGGASRKIDLWDIVGGSLKSVKKLEGSNGTITSVDFDPSGQHIIAASYGNAAHLWNINHSLPKVSLTGHERKVTAAKFMSILHRAVTCSWDRTVKVWDLTKGDCVSTINVPSLCTDVVCADYYIISGHQDGKIRFWDYRLKQCMHEIPPKGKITSLSLNYNQTQLLSCSRDDELNMIDLRMTRVCLSSKVFRADGFKCGCDWTKAIFSPDGNYVMAGSSDGTLYIWNVNTGKLEKSLNEEHRSSVNAVAWSLSGEYVASVDRSKKAILWSEF